MGTAGGGAGDASLERLNAYPWRSAAAHLAGDTIADDHGPGTPKGGCKNERDNQIWCPWNYRRKAQNQRHSRAITLSAATARGSA